MSNTSMPARRRSRASAKKAGSGFERTIADWLAGRLGDDRIDRRVKTGALDKGDIGGVRTVFGDRVVVEVKNTTRFSLAGWLREVETERVNDGAHIGVVIHKRHGVAAPDQQYVTMSAETLARLLDGGPRES